MRNSTHIITTAAMAMLLASSLFAQDEVPVKSQLSLCGHLADCGSSEAGCAVPDDSCGRHCDDCNKCCFEPTWEFRGGWLMFRRDVRGTGTAASFGPGLVLSTINQYETDYSPGFELNARRRFDTRVVELNYFQIDSFRATVSGPSTPAEGTFFSDYDSALYNFEANILTDTDSPLRLLAGFRYIAYNDSLDQQSNTIYSKLSVNNDLFGGQVGGELDLYPFNRYDGRFHLRAFAKLGIFGQNSSANSILLAGPFNIPVASSSSNDTTLVTEAGITGGVQVAPAVTIDWGYRVLFLDGVATAGDTGVASNVGGGTTTVGTGSVLFHGFSVSTTLTY